MIDNISLGILHRIHQMRVVELRVRHEERDFTVSVEEFKCAR